MMEEFVILELWSGLNGEFGTGLGPIPISLPKKKDMIQKEVYSKLQKAGTWCKDN